MCLLSPLPVPFILHMAFPVAMDTDRPQAKDNEEEEEEGSAVNSLPF